MSTIMIKRFNKSRWSETRTAIHALALSSRVAFPPSEYFNAHASVQRLNDAYDNERTWILSGGKGKPIVTRIK